MNKYKKLLYTGIFCILLAAILALLNIILFHTDTLTRCAGILALLSIPTISYSTAKITKSK